MLRNFWYSRNYTGLSRISFRSFAFQRGQSLYPLRAFGRFRTLASLATNQSRPEAPLVLPSSMLSESFGNFDLIKRVDVSYSPIRVSKWRSRVTGLTVVHIDYEGPDLLSLLVKPISLSLSF